MKIAKTNNINFKAKVDKKFISNAQKYYLKRNLAIQERKVVKTADALELFGDENTHIVYKAVPQDNGFLHLLCLKNRKINDKKAVIMTQSERYRDITEFFMGLTNEAVKNWENLLKNANNM